MSQAERLWRVRKANASIDARISGTERPGGARVDFFYDGSCIFSREFQTRDLAIDDASRTLHDLERVGWNAHW